MNPERSRFDKQIDIFPIEFDAVESDLREYLSSAMTYPGHEVNFYGRESRSGFSAAVESIMYDYSYAGEVAKCELRVDVSQPVSISGLARIILDAETGHGELIVPGE